MSNRYRSNPLHPVPVPNVDVTRYETLPLKQVQEELRAAGIDPAPTIAAVRRLIEESIARTKPPAPSPVPAAHHEDADGDDY